MSRRFHKNIECLKLKLPLKGKKPSNFPKIFMVHFYLCCLECCIFFNSLSASSLFPVSWKKKKKKRNQIMKVTFSHENESHMKTMLRPLNPFCLLVWSQLAQSFSNNIRNCDCSTVRIAILLEARLSK